MAIINKTRLEQYLKLNYNVLFSGRHGVGKTMVIKDTFESAGLRWKYFSASTLDPWVDFVGVPKVIDREGLEPYLGLIRPKFIQDDEIDAIFFDELNRAPDKVLNAIMELIQFKSINGYKLKNLKVIWAAINPEDDDDTYSVNHLDPAQVDRFHVKIDVPFDVDKDFFLAKYPAIGQTFIDWWKLIPENIRYSVSPRRLDYAADAFVNDCRLEDFLPTESGVAKLRTMLKSLPFHEQIAEVNSAAEAEVFLKNINNATKLLEMVKVKDALAIDFFVKYASTMPKELVEPFIDYVNAQKAGLDVVASIEELIDLLPNTEGNASTAALINNVDFKILYKAGGTLYNDLVALNKQKKNLIHKLANRCCDVMLRCHGQTLERIFWGIEGKAANKQTNFQELILLLSRVDPSLFSVAQRQTINKKLYQKKTVDAMNFL
jgi:hypothetical protein